MSQHQRELKRRLRQRALSNRVALSAPRRLEIHRMAELEHQPPIDDVPTAEAIASFQAMMAERKAVIEGSLAAAQAKREQRKARNLLQSNRVVCGGA